MPVQIYLYDIEGRCSNKNGQQLQVYDDLLIFHDSQLYNFDGHLELGDIVFRVTATDTSAFIIAYSSVVDQLLTSLDNISLLIASFLELFAKPTDRIHLYVKDLDCHTISNYDASKRITELIQDIPKQYAVVVR